MFSRRFAMCSCRNYVFWNWGLRSVPKFKQLSANLNQLSQRPSSFILAKKIAPIICRPSVTPVQIDTRFLHNITRMGQRRQKSRNRYKKCETERLKSTEAGERVIKDLGKETAEFIGETATIPTQAKEIYYEESRATQECLKLFPMPKNTLHNAYQLLTDETKKQLKVSPSYKSDKNKRSSIWLCTYHVRWPEDMKFLAKDSKKAIASHKAALAALTWLREEKKITEQGAPIIYDRDQVKKLTTKTIPTLALSKQTEQNLERIVALHQKEMVPHIVSNTLKAKDDNNNEIEEDEVVTEIDNVNLKAVKKQRYLGLQEYAAKEKVELPITAYKQELKDLVKSNRILIVKGEPGCGKSTRVPQYVLEAWAEEDGLLGHPGRIAVTQPRRIAAISLAERVAHERNESAGRIVGYQVRLNAKFQPITGRILYCTTGIMLRHLQSDQTLANFSHIILDEAHERDVNTDLLMNLIKDALKVNERLRLIVMSATIDTDMFSEYYDGAPVMNIPGFTYPVKQHFLDHCKIDVSKTLKMCESSAPSVVHEEVVKVLEFIHKNKPEGAILCFLPGWEDIRKIEKLIPVRGDVVVYCLHSRLQDSDQWKVFSRPPPGIRKIILATNIAETSVTIDDVVYVVDTGIQKEQRFDVEKGINCVDNHWLSKANTTQRKGRAGRVQPGESYHLYPSSKFESFPEYSMPEIMRTSLTKILLNCKVFSSNMNALEFMGKLPTPPEQEATVRAVNELVDLELLDAEENLTSLGKTLSNFQLEPRLAKAMVNAVVFKCVTPVVDIVTLYSAETEFFISGLIDKEGVKQVKARFCPNSDHIAMMRVFEKWLEYNEQGDSYRTRRFCDEVKLIPYKMGTLEKIRKIHFDYLYNGLFDVMSISDDFSDNDELVKAVLFSGVGSVLQHRNWDIAKNRLKNNVNIFLTRNNQKATISSESVNFKRRKFPSNLLLYINETRSNIRRTTVVRECSLISNIAVLLFSNKDLEIRAAGQEYTRTPEGSDLVKLVLKDTNIQFLCEETQAQTLVKCKDALMAGYRYYVRNLTDIAEHNDEVNESWNSILSVLNKILKEHSV